MMRLYANAYSAKGASDDYTADNGYNTYTANCAGSINMLKMTTLLTV